MNSQHIVYLQVEALRPYPNNARTHSRKQVRQLADSIARFGFTNPVLIDAQNMILAGHGRVEAAKLLGMGEVPCVCLEHMSADEKRAYVLADNKLALNAGWDEDILADELQALLEVDVDFDISITGFSLAKIDTLVEGAAPEEPSDPAADVVPVDPGRRAAAKAICGSSARTVWSAATRSILGQLRS